MLDQMRAHFFQPLRLDARHTAGIQSGRFGQFGCHDPFRRFFCERRTGDDKKLYFAGSLIVSFAVHIFAAYIAQKARQKRLVDLLIAGGQFIQPHAHFCNLDMQLMVELVPFAQADGRQKLFAAFFCPHTVGFFMFYRFLEPCPQIYVGQKIGAFVMKTKVRLVCGFAPFGGAVSWVL